MPSHHLSFGMWTFVKALSLLSSRPTGIRAAPTSGLPSAASFYVPTIPGLEDDPIQPLHVYAGHLPSDPDAQNAPATEVTAHLYFFMVKARRTADKERIMFWFNGGPGCSSFDGLMMEVGPWRVDGKGGLKRIEGGWEEYTTMVYIDQPVGTGFSYTSSNKFVHELPEASQHIVQFLSNFYTVFPEYKQVDAYLGGESFAGQYIPYFADAILSSDLHIPFKGVAIGNGWIDGKAQYPAYLDYALKYQLIQEGSDHYKNSKTTIDKCMQKLEEYKDVYPVHDDFCEDIIGIVMREQEKMVDGKKKCLNMYDIRLMDDSPACGMNWPPDLKGIGEWLHRKDVTTALHVPTLPPWEECRSRIHRLFHTKHSNSSVTLLPRILEKVEVLLFAGDQDLICNYMGIEKIVSELKWGGETGLGTVQTQSWTVDGQPAGTWVSSRNLTYAKIFNASHMVGYDVPQVSHDMILRFMGMNFSALTDGTLRIPSSIGTSSKPIPSLIEAPGGVIPTQVAGGSSGPGGGTGSGSGKSPQQDKAMWEAYYNAGSAALVLAIIGILIGLLIWWRVRRSKGGLRLPGLPLSRSGPEGSADTFEEHIPLTQNGGYDEADGDDGGPRSAMSTRRGKGKQRAEEEGKTPTTAGAREEIFGVGDSDDEDGKSPRPQL